MSQDGTPAAAIASQHWLYPWRQFSPIRNRCAINSGTLALQVLELIPPYVQTELMGPEQAGDPNAMPLQDFIAEVIGILKASPDAVEICVERVKPLRFAEANGGYDAFFQKFNDARAHE